MPRKRIKKRQKKATRQAFRTDGILGAIREARNIARSRASPEQLGNVPAPTRDMGAIERGLNYAAQSSPGAAFASATNAFAAGLPTAIGGEQDKLEMLKDTRQPQFCRARCFLSRRLSVGDAQFRKA